MRRRGLKPASCNISSRYACVASRAEAWIETQLLLCVRLDLRVASRAEAWIETVELAKKYNVKPVASRAEAWIETITFD